MKKILISVISIVFVLVAITIAYPKNSGGVLCGPICLKTGLHYYKKPCYGFERKINFIDGHRDVCYGIVLPQQKCYGVPTGSDNDQDVEMKCDDNN